MRTQLRTQLPTELALGVFLALGGGLDVDVLEQPVPQETVEGEIPWPTQPAPTLPAPISRQQLTQENLNRVTPAIKKWSEEEFASIRSNAPFEPPSLEGTVILPGLDGGGEWGGAAVDPTTGVLYANASEMPWLLRLFEVQEGDARTTADLGRRTYAQHCLSCHGVGRDGSPHNEDVPDLRDLEREHPRTWVRRLLKQGKGRMPTFEFLRETQTQHLIDFLYNVNSPLPEDDASQGGSYGQEGPRTLPYALVAFQRLSTPEGYPMIEPPWGTLSAIDLNTGQLLWQVPHGDFPEIDRSALTPYGLERTGSEQYGGPIVTGGGLIFIAATRDEAIHAYDQKTGQLLWRDVLPAGGYATPATYAANGRQFVVIAAGGGKMGTKSSDTWVAYALPDAPTESKRPSDDK